jgi:hypothetical protein
LRLPLKEGLGDERRPKDRVKDRVTLRISLMYIPEETQQFFSFRWRIFANFEPKKSDFDLNKGFLKSKFGPLLSKKPHIIQNSTSCQISVIYSLT